MDKNSLTHKMVFGKNRNTYFYVFLALVAATIISGIFLPNLIIILGACAFTVLILLIVDISNVKRFGRFYAIDVIDNQIVEISEKNGERIVRPEDIAEIVQPKDLNLLNPERMNRNEQFFYIKLKDGKTLGVSGMISGYDVFARKVMDYAALNNLNVTTKLTGFL